MIQVAEGAEHCWYLWRILINSAQLSKLAFSYFEISSYVHHHGFASNFALLGLSVIYPKYPVVSTFLSLATCRLKVSFNLHCYPAEFVRFEGQKFPKKSAKKLHVNKCHTLNCGSLDMSSRLCCCCEFETVASPATERCLSISDVTYFFLVTSCWFSQYFCYSLRFKVSGLHALLTYLLCHCNLKKPWPSYITISYPLDSTQLYFTALSHHFILFLMYSVTFADCNSGLTAAVGCMGGGSWEEPCG